METIVAKIGGENAADIRTADWVRTHCSSHRIVLAISALRIPEFNTTSHLIEAMKHKNQGNDRESARIVDAVRRELCALLARTNLSDNTLKSIIDTCITDQMIRGISAPEAGYVGLGEILAANIWRHLLHVRENIQATVVDTSVITYGEDDPSHTLSQVLGDRVHACLQNHTVAIIPGYIAMSDHQTLDLYGRGYTDKTAERIATGLAQKGEKVTLQIHKQVPLYSSHPKNGFDIHPIRNISYWNAAEITGARGANAQVLNEHVITADVMRLDIPIMIFDPFDTSGVKTYISEKGDGNSFFVDKRDHISTLTLSGCGMYGVGILSRLTDIFGQLGISIDSLSSSETEVTLTTYSRLEDTAKNTLKNLISREIGDQYACDISDDMSMIYCVGDRLSEVGAIARITHELNARSIPIKCMSLSKGQRSVMIGVDTLQAQDAVRIIHEELYNPEVLGGL